MRLFNILIETYRAIILQCEYLNSEQIGKGFEFESKDIIWKKDKLDHIVWLRASCALPFSSRQILRAVKEMSGEFDEISVGAVLIYLIVSKPKENAR